MKHMKKVLTMLLAMAMVLAMSVTAFADPQTNSLTINGTTAGKSYDLYKVFDLTQDGDAYSYTVNTAFAGYFTAESITDPIKYVGDMTSDSDELSELAQKLVAYALANNVEAAERVTATGTTTTVADLEYGYYVLNPLGGSEAKTGYATMFSLGTVGETATINIKAEYPTTDKTIVGGTADKISNASIGDEVNYKLTSKVPDLTGYTSYFFCFNDTLSAGLDFKADSVAVKVGDITLTKDAKTNGFKVVYNEGERKLYIELTDFTQYAENAGDAIEVTYTAILNENAVVAPGSNDNDVILKYSNDPTVDYSGDHTPDNPPAPVGETPSSKTKTYTTELIIHKVDENGKALTGASFKIEGNGVNVVVVTKDSFEKDNEKGTYYKLKDGTYTETVPSADVDTSKYESTEDKYSKTTSSEVMGTGKTNTTVEAAVGADGKLTFTGLGAGEYTITETVVPNGYNAIDPITVTITFETKTDDNGNEVFDKFKAASKDAAFTDGNVISVNIVNQSGSVLPSTGGIGTTIFYVVGGLLVLGAAVMLITRKRMNVVK